MHEPAGLGNIAKLHARGIYVATANWKRNATSVGAVTVRRLLCERSAHGPALRHKRRLACSPAHSKPGAAAAAASCDTSVSAPPWSEWLGGVYAASHKYRDVAANFGTQQLWWQFATSCERRGAAAYFSTEQRLRPEHMLCAQVPTCRHSRSTAAAEKRRVTACRQSREAFSAEQRLRRRTQRRLRRHGATSCESRRAAREPTVWRDRGQRRTEFATRPEHGRERRRSDLTTHREPRSGAS